MEDYSDLIIKIARSPEALDADDLSALARACRDYPASAVAAAAMLKYGSARLADDERAALQRRVALLGGDCGRLIEMIDPSGRGFDDFYPPEPVVVKPATESAIDTFLETYGHRSPEEDALLERMIFNPVPDYSETLARTEKVAPATGGQDSLIDAFLAANPVSQDEAAEASDVPPLYVPAATPTPPPQPQAARPAASAAAPPPADGLLSESLAKIFIKQGRYDRAYEIISNLNLNYPEKSIYFADQLRFLRKLMANQRHAPAAETGKN